MKRDPKDPKYARLLADALTWLDEEEKKLGIKLDREAFVRDLLEHIAEE